jgi:CRISPR-associated protein Cst2
MALHVFGAVVTHNGIAANNRGENEGNITTLQKILWKDQVHTTVSSEAIRWAMRYYWQTSGIPVNRKWIDAKEEFEWQDPNWQGWSSKEGETFIDDDMLGYMRAEGGKTEGEKGKADKRRGVLEIARAISLTPYAGDITFNAKSGVKGRTSLYGTECHSTQYQYGFALTPERLRERDRALQGIQAVCDLGKVAGNHSRFLFDFSPESIVLRITHDPAPRILYCFELDPNGELIAPGMVTRVRNRDIEASELFIGGPISGNDSVKSLDAAHRYDGIKQAVSSCVVKIKELLEI